MSVGGKNNIAMDKMVYKLTESNKEIPKEFQDSEGLLKCLIVSLFDVKTGYIFYRKSERGAYLPQTERVFAYEFYRRWADNVSKNLQNYIVNGEPEKNVSKFRNTKHQYPDLVLHHSQGDYSNQGVVCEIKRKDSLTSSNFKDDINKLYHFVCAQQCKYRFKYGVFVLVGGKMDAIFKIILKINNELLTFNENNRKLNRIICITYDGTVLELCHLQRIINSSRDEMKELINKYKNERQN